MSVTFESDTHRDDLIDFLFNEHLLNTGIPVHPYSVVNATFSSFNRMLAITDNAGGTLILEDEYEFKCYGVNNPIPMIRALNSCCVGIR